MARVSRVSRLGGVKRLNTVDTTDPRIITVSYRLCGDRRRTRQIARKYLALLERYPRITLPEAIVYIYLEEMRETFEFQGDVAGGRSQYGGAVIDFYLPLNAIIFRVQGDYWHSLPGARERDLVQKEILEGSVINGRRTTAVVDLWESQLLSCRRRRVIKLATIGIEVPR